MPLGSRCGGPYFPSLHGQSVLCGRFDVRDIRFRSQYQIRFFRTRVYKFRTRLFSAVSRSPYGRDGRRASVFFIASFFAASRSCPSRASQRRARSLHFTRAYAPLVKNKARQIFDAIIVRRRPTFYALAPSQRFLDRESLPPRPGAVAGRYHPFALGRRHCGPRKPFWFLYTRR